MTTKPEWEVDLNNINPGDVHAGLHNAINHVYSAGYSTEENDDFGIARQEVQDEVNKILASHLTGTVKVEELRTKIIELGKEKNNLIDIEEGKVEAMYLWSVLALLDEKK